VCPNKDRAARSAFVFTHGSTDGCADTPAMRLLFQFAAAFIGITSSRSPGFLCAIHASLRQTHANGHSVNFISFN